mmetsp:Transcript_85812/g.228069  ORF Transcript_85812/g.228069 Transcript_85812/m.228069 type:complete len:265 (+) Transcript_85812:562-1356(+)
MAAGAHQGPLAVHLPPDWHVVLHPARHLAVLALQERLGRGCDPKAFHGRERAPGGLRDSAGCLLALVLHHDESPLAVRSDEDRLVNVSNPVAGVLAVHPPVAFVRQLRVVSIHGPELRQVPFNLVAMVCYHPEASGAAEEPAFAVCLLPDGLSVCERVRQTAVHALQRGPVWGHEPELVGAQDSGRRVRKELVGDQPPRGHRQGQGAGGLLLHVAHGPRRPRLPRHAAASGGRSVAHGGVEGRAGVGRVGTPPAAHAVVHRAAD